LCLLLKKKNLTFPVPLYNSLWIKTRHFCKKTIFLLPFCRSTCSCGSGWWCWLSSLPSPSSTILSSPSSPPSSPPGSRGGSGRSELCAGCPHRPLAPLPSCPRPRPLHPRLLAQEEDQVDQNFVHSLTILNETLDVRREREAGFSVLRAPRRNIQRQGG